MLFRFQKDLWIWSVGQQQISELSQLSYTEFYEVKQAHSKMLHMTERFSPALWIAKTGGKKRSNIYWHQQANHLDLFQHCLSSPLHPSAATCSLREAGTTQLPPKTVKNNMSVVSLFQGTPSWQVCKAEAGEREHFSHLLLASFGSQPCYQATTGFLSPISVKWTKFPYKLHALLSTTHRMVNFLVSYDSAGAQHIIHLVS